MPLDDLDREKLGPLSVRFGEERAELRSAADMKWQEVAACIDSVPAFISLVLPKDLPLGLATVERLHVLWIEHNGLTHSDSATRRLARAMDKFFPAIEADFARFYAGTSPGALWRGRQWRYLLNLIDHLPQNTQYYHQLMQDEEHAAAVADWKAKHPEEKDDSPPWSTWSPEVELLTRIEDQLKIVANRVVAAQGGKAPKPEFASRPKSAIQKAILRNRWKQHDALKAKLIKPQPPS